MHWIGSLLFSFSLLILVSSCQKNPSVDILPEASCELSKAYYYDETGAIADSLVYTYTGNKITKAANGDGYITLEYNNDKVTKRNFYDQGDQQPGSYDVFSYNTDGSIKSIKTYFQFDFQVIPAWQYEFSYSGNKLAKFEIMDYNTVTSQYELNESTTYIYTGENITQSVTTHSFGNSDNETFNYAYDNTKNYFIQSNGLFLHLAFMDGIDGSLVPLFISSNNVINVSEDGDDFPLSYKADDNGNFAEWYLDGKLG